jgi:hypothetical protein
MNASTRSAFGRTSPSAPGAVTAAFSITDHVAVETVQTLEDSPAGSYITTEEK